MSRRRRKKKEIELKKTKTKLKFSLSLNTFLLIIIPVILIGTSLAKYISERTSDLVYEAKNFYFESNLLSDNTNPSAYTYDVGTDTISFKLKNNIDDLRHSEVDIEYTVKITDIQGNSVTDKDGNVVGSLTGTLSKNGIDSDELEFTNLPSGNYLITADAISPYVKKLQGSFVLTGKDEEIMYSVNDSLGSPIVLLTVSTEDYEGDINISWTSGLAPDSTSSIFENVNSGYASGSIETSFESNSEFTFQFFKNNPNNLYSKSNFTVGRSE